MPRKWDEPEGRTVTISQLEHDHLLRDQRRFRFVLRAWARLSGRRNQADALEEIDALLADADELGGDDALDKIFGRTPAPVPGKRK